MKKFIAPLMATALIFAGSAAFAEDAAKPDRKPPHDRFKEADSNSDGFLTKEEMKKGQEKRLDEMFSRTDADKDGKLSPEEMKKGREEMRKKWKERRAEHKDGDGKGPPPPEGE
ncbi:MAG: hypothetical protein DI586_02745 [Micavibrio aeruginosavorus]|uniref:EF-hand domain-containing protein n=1 Tax=Micavibrio aeruginosavorus TaxID=349221 RepID=A0A2W5FL09_9BACT|nr:MAG: hypothetical protein DI586_02745 [Micavibrio aeruginosavorus]